MAPPAYHVGQRVLHSCLLGSGERALYKATVQEVSASGRGYKYTLAYDDGHYILTPPLILGFLTERCGAKTTPAVYVHVCAHHGSSA